MRALQNEARRRRDNQRAGDTRRAAAAELTRLALERAAVSVPRRERMRDLVQDHVANHLRIVEDHEVPRQRYAFAVEPARAQAALGSIEAEAPVAEAMLFHDLQGQRPRLIKVHALL